MLCTMATDAETGSFLLPAIPASLQVQLNKCIHIDQRFNRIQRWMVTEYQRIIYIYQYEGGFRIGAPGACPQLEMFLGLFCEIWLYFNCSQQAMSTIWILFSTLLNYKSIQYVLRAQKQSSDPKNYTALGPHPLFWNF